MDMDTTLAEPLGGLDGIDQSSVFDRRQPEAVLHDLEHATAARMDAAVALAFEVGPDLVLAKVVRHAQRRAQHQSRITGRIGPAPQVGGDALRRVPMHRLAALTAMEVGGAGIQQLEVVGQLGHRADRRA